MSHTWVIQILLQKLQKKLRLNFSSKAFESKFRSFPMKLAVLAARFTPSNIIVVTKFLFSYLTLLEVNQALIAWSYRYG